MPDTKEPFREFAAALSKAQGECVTVGKDGYNKHAQYNYATSEAVIRATRKPLSDNGLSFLYSWREERDGNDNEPTIHMDWILSHAGGHFIERTCSMKSHFNKLNCHEQRTGTTLSYLHSYVLRAILNLDRDEEEPSSVDSVDHGNDAPPPAQAPVDNKDRITDAKALLRNRIGVRSPADMRALLDWLGLEGVTPESVPTNPDHAKRVSDAVAEASKRIAPEKILDAAKATLETEAAVDEAFPTHAERVLSGPPDYPG